MTAATASPLAARDRLLQAIDSQSNVSNMVVVLDVISFLEKYPITKEALEETRLGKLINDVRRKTQNAELAKRAKKLLRAWQQLLLPGSAQSCSKTDNNTPRCSAHGSSQTWSSSHGSSYAHISSSVPPTRKTTCELKSRNDFNNCKAGKKHHKKRKGDHNVHEPTKVSKTTPDRTHLKIAPNSNGMNGLRIQVNKPLSTSLLLKASVIQQQAASSRGEHTKRTTCSSSQQETVKKAKQQPHSLCLSREDVQQIDSESLKLSSCGLSMSVEKQACVNTFGDNKKTVKFKDKPLVFNPITCQIKCNQQGETENELQNVNHKMLTISSQGASSSYLSHQSLLAVSRASFVSSALDGKGEQSVPLPESPSVNVPGVNRPVTGADVQRLHTQRWPGVNGLLNPSGQWSDWTQSFSIDLDADGSKLDVLPYVCLY
ncbi:mediator of RNA polymerase II transcription subunit 26 [Boleophthalmus pectinirostris]|uniref:mediator of RNA polymerase II transcription subunit 26 n=1 Tax=Boleophthalmus pectinirostris TaxID=150288 RepID=UPI000A1C5CF2|nr:mediator of RNA polymerase II transcription subunit 26 [Boleophthalmus pectinirostris]